MRARRSLCYRTESHHDGGGTREKDKASGHSLATAQRRTSLATCAAPASASASPSAPTDVDWPDTSLLDIGERVQDTQAQEEAVVVELTSRRISSSPPAVETGACAKQPKPEAKRQPCELTCIQSFPSPTQTQTQPVLCPSLLKHCATRHTLPPLQLSSPLSLSRSGGLCL